MLHITEIEKAINIWRGRAPATEASGCAVCPEVNALADVYAMMIVNHQTEIAEDVLTEGQARALSMCLDLPAALREPSVEPEGEQTSEGMRA
jgi:hypothetical protein